LQRSKPPEVLLHKVASLLRPCSAPTEAHVYVLMFWTKQFYMLNVQVFASTYACLDVAQCCSTSNHVTMAARTPTCSSGQRRASRRQLLHGHGHSRHTPLSPSNLHEAGWSATYSGLSVQSFRPSGCRLNAATCSTKNARSKEPTVCKQSKFLGLWVGFQPTLVGMIQHSQCHPKRHAVVGRPGHLLEQLPEERHLSGGHARLKMVHQVSRRRAAIAGL